MASSSGNLKDDGSPAHHQQVASASCGQCASMSLVEIIRLHTCLRVAFGSLEKDVNELRQALQTKHDRVAELEKRVECRFKVIWSVFRAHSAAEDEFIWPALQSKTLQLSSAGHHHHSSHNDLSQQAVAHGASSNNKEQSQPQQQQQQEKPPQKQEKSVMIEQEEYKEDHQDANRMFSMIDVLLTRLRNGLSQRQQEQQQLLSVAATAEAAAVSPDSVDKVAKAIYDLTKALSQHVTKHLEKEETQCMPLVMKHLSQSEMNDLVGQVMGKRSSDTMEHIMTTALQDLGKTDRESMMRYMKQAMEGTFFDRWLDMSGFMSSSSSSSATANATSAAASAATTTTDTSSKSLLQTKPSPAAGTSTAASSSVSKKHSLDTSLTSGCPAHKRPREDTTSVTRELCDTCKAIGYCIAGGECNAAAVDFSTKAGLEKLIRAVASNPSLNPVQKNTTIQGLRDSVWKISQRQKEGTSLAATAASLPFHVGLSVARTTPNTSPGDVSTRRVNPPSVYYKKNPDGRVELVWSSFESSLRHPRDESVPLFSPSELAPTYNDGATGAVLGCPHYARACKLRHPSSGRLYTCRLCCEQEREKPTRNQDEPLDRYAVSEVMCMKCNALQPADDKCINPQCEAFGKPYAKYHCRICNLYDDRLRPIFHCPYCNTCRSGEGLGIDYRHCMRCNACVSISDDDHCCIPQKLQGSCPICNESMFQSTKPLRGLKCGHVMHLACYTLYRREHSYKCPLCMRSMDDMKDYFALLDSAVRMQPMPMAYLSTVSNIFCQDCDKTSKVPYHFVGLKCIQCGSYNTREMGREHVAGS